MGEFLTSGNLDRVYVFTLYIYGVLSQEFAIPLITI